MGARAALRRAPSLSLPQRGRGLRYRIEREGRLKG